jgi:hypothetical protein
MFLIVKFTYIIILVGKGPTIQKIPISGKALVPSFPVNVSPVNQNMKEKDLWDDPE